MLREICSIVVLYNPDKDVFRNIGELADQSDFVIAINNGFMNSRQFYNSFEEYPNNVQLVNLGRNEGIAYALNTGIEIARRLGYRWIATFDQDSTISRNYFKEMFHDYEKSGIKNIAVIAPVYYSKSTGIMTTYTSNRYKIYKSTGYKFVDTTITSGNIIDLYLILNKEPFRSELFIDQVDNDFNLSIIDLGLLILETNAVLFHNLGDQRMHKFLNKSPTTNNHSAFRRYFMTRNRIYMYKKYFSRHKSWVIYDFKHGALEIIKTVMFEDDKLAKLKSTALGVFHGLIFNIGEFKSLNYRYTHQSTDYLKEEE